MSYQVKITPFANETAKLLNPDVKKSLKTALEELSITPYLGKELQENLNGFRSYRVLRYRIIFKADTHNKMIVVWAIGHRRDIYETLSEYLLLGATE